MKGQKRRFDACARMESLIPMYVDGELNTRRAKAVRRHLDACPSCAAQARELEELSRLIARSEGEHMPEVSKDLHASIMQSVAQSPRIAPQADRSRRMGWRLGGALVALVLMCGVLLMPGGPLNPLAHAPSHDAMRPGMDGTGDGNGNGIASPGEDAPGDAPDDNEMEPDDSNKGDPSVYYFFRVDGDVESPEPPAEDSPSYGGEGDSSGDDFDNVMDGAPGGDSSSKDEVNDFQLLKLLNGEWESDAMTLCLDAEYFEFYLVIEGKGEYEGDFSLTGGVLLLQFENGERVSLEARVKGGTLCLTKRS